MSMDKGDKILTWLLASIFIILVIVLPLAIPVFIEGIEEDERKLNTEILIHEGILDDIEIVKTRIFPDEADVLLKFQDGKVHLIELTFPEIDDIKLGKRYELTENALTDRLTLKIKDR